MADSTRKIRRIIEREGWQVEQGRKHLRLTHPLARWPVFAGASPSDSNAMKLTLKEMRRALKATEARE